MKLFTKRRAIFALTTALLVVVVGGAYAYFTTTGLGTGTAGRIVPFITAGNHWQISSG